MRKILLVLAMACMSACELSFDGITALDGQAMLIANQGRIGYVRCGADSLALVTHEVTDCVAFNPVGTRIAFDGNAIAVWRSSAPSVITVAVDGQIQADAFPGTAWIIAEGTFGTSDSVQVTAY